jgi:hypothetical protein
MTSIDFASKYRLLKNVATRGARSFLAQQVSLGRMVMVHYLDSETPEQRTATLARLDALKPPAREKLVEIADVDGSPVAVTQFISSFVDFSTWLDQVSPASAIPAAPPTPKIVEAAPGDFTRAFNKIEAPAAPPVIPRAPERPRAAQSPAAPPPPPPTPARSAGEFTKIFGKVDFGQAKPAAAPRAEAAPAPTPDELNSPTVIIAAPKSAPKQAAPPPPPVTTVPPPPVATVPPPAADASSGFTAIFGRAGAQLPGNLPPATPNPAPAAPAAGRVMQPAPTPDFDRSAPPPPPMASTPSQQAGEFTQLFQRISPSSAPPSSVPPSTPMPSFGLPPGPEAQRPIEPAPLADLAPSRLTAPPASSPSELPPPALGGAVPPAAFSLGNMLPAPSLGSLSNPALPNTPRPDAPNDAMASPNVPPPPALPWAAPPTAAGPGNMFATATGQSEFTRILGRVAVPPPPPPPIAIQPPAGAGASAPAGQKPKSMLPLIAGLSVVILLSIAIVGYFLRRG